MTSVCLLIYSDLDWPDGDYEFGLLLDVRVGLLLPVPIGDAFVTFIDFNCGNSSF